MKDYFRGKTADRLFKELVEERNTLQHTQCVESVGNALDVEERKEITLDDVLKYCNAHRLIVISEELFYRLNHMTIIPNRTEEQ